MALASVLTVHRHTQDLGRFDTEVEAAMQYDLAVIDSVGLSAPQLRTWLVKSMGGKSGGGGQMGGAGTRKKGRGGTRDWSVVHGTQRPCVSLLHYFFNTYNNI